MTDLYLLRHAIAVARRAADTDDQDRQRALTDEGRAKLARVAAAMATLKLKFDLILTSPYLRAEQTAAVVAARLKARRQLRLCEGLAPSGRPAELVRYLASLRPRPASVLLVGHEPYLSGLMSFLLTGKAGLSIDFKKAGLAKLSLAKLQAGPGATLEWLLTPKQMGLIG